MISLLLSLIEPPKPVIQYEAPLIVEEYTPPEPTEAPTQEVIEEDDTVSKSH